VKLSSLFSLKELVFACMFLWIGKGAFLLTGGKSILASVLFAGLSACCALLSLRFLKRGSKEVHNLSRVFSQTFVFTLLSSCIFVPDLFMAAFLESALFAAPFVLAVLILGSFVVSFLRLPAFFLLFYVQKKWAPVLSYVMLCLIEPLFLLFFPILYWTAFPLPVVLAGNESRTANTDSSVGEHAPRAHGEKLVFLVDPQLTDNLRQQIAEGGNTQLQQEAERVAQGLIASRRDLGYFQNVTLMFPETTYFLDVEAFSRFYDFLVQSLQKEGLTFEFELIVGAQFGAVNVIFYGGKDSVTERPVRGVLTQKAEGVPFFERDVLGVRLRKAVIDMDEELPFDAQISRQLTSRWESDWQPQVYKICYESLNPLNWKAKEPVVVLTNHNQFKAFGVASRLYDHTIRLLAWAFRSPLILVANFGTSGFFPAQTEGGLEESAKKPPQRKFVILQLPRP
jgi:hypothetical protein